MSIERCANMNKIELLKLVDSLDLPKEEYYILGTGSLLLHDLKKQANDLDLCVSKELFEEMVEKFHIDLSSKNECGFFRLNDLTEVVVSEKDTFHRTFQDGYPVEKLELILAYKINRNAPKDQADIITIQNYLNNPIRKSEQ